MNRTMVVRDIHGVLREFSMSELADHKFTILSMSMDQLVDLKRMWDSISIHPISEERVDSLIISFCNMGKDNQELR